MKRLVHGIGFGPLLDLKSHIVLVLEGGPRYGGELKSILGAGPRIDYFAPPKKPSNSTLYPALRKLEDEGFLESEVRRDPGRKGPPRIYYSLTGKGDQLLTQIKDALGQLASGKTCEVDVIPKTFPKAARNIEILPEPAPA